MAGAIMFEHILLPTDGSELSMKAVQRGMAFAKGINARVTGFYARPHLEYDYYIGLSRAMPADLESRDKRLEEASRAILDHVATEARNASVTCDCFSVVSDSPFEAIIAAARERGCDLILMASHGRRGMSAVVIGSVTQKVLTHCTTPVLVMR
jgi:nucleotide-binding universal stress UspA family protein